MFRAHKKISIVCRAVKMTTIIVNSAVQKITIVRRAVKTTVNSVIVVAE